MNKPEFINEAFKIRNFLLGEHQEIINSKTSRYNSNVYMHKCEWDGCNETTHLESHHIKFQRDADENNLNDGYIQKNQQSNIMVLCKKHHQLIDA